MSYKSLLDDCGFKNIPNGWDVYNLDDICSGIIDCPHSTPKLVENSSYYVAKTQDVRSGHFNPMDADCVSESTYLDRIKRAEPEQGDILLSREGTYFGDAAEVPANTKVCLGQRMVLIRPRKDIVDPSFLRLFINSKGFQKYLSRFHEGTVAQRINVSEIRKLPILLPDRDTQEFIKSKMLPIEQKARLNTQINQTLEEMAQAIFKSWFVDFDPVKAKMNGKQPEGVDAATASLFPEKLVESELGLIPEGWDAVQVGDIVQRLKPKKRFTKKQVEPYGKTPVYEQGASILLGFHGDDAGFEASPEDPVFIFGDHTCITHLSCSKFDISSNVIPLKGSVRPTIWTYYAIQGKQEFQEYRRHWSEFIIKDVVLPSVELAEKYAELVTTKYLMMESLKRQSKELEQLRDTLLPKLLSGEIELAPQGNQ
ncbi:restriction endonuclease subunit S [Vibrio kanaloae]|uniref:restriction endonuclease subunit S n=1 Tax=Vibrio kanaloae TaxID=170673 RepID=UPI0009896CAE|nr:restriction endonuclease subunit S [Vibrio kanaloae]QPK03406.1 restriction endonuclease subunit S [Vibrio kanaloae]